MVNIGRLIAVPECPLGQTRKPENSLLAEVLTISNLPTKTPFSKPVQEREVSQDLLAQYFVLSESM
jgi:hypothetical protein